ncbi:MAG: hypothetical protein WAO02_01265 [Verrucomicrobiia bacterium]
MLGNADIQWLQVFAEHAAVSIANVPAFEEIEFLHAGLEEENGQIREEFRDLIEEDPSLTYTKAWTVNAVLEGAD